MTTYDRPRIRGIFTDVNLEIGDDLTDALEDGVRDLATRADVESLRDDTRGMFAALEARMRAEMAAFEARMQAEMAALEARQARTTLALAALFIATHGITTGIIIAVLG